MTDRCLADWLTLLETRHPCDIELGLDRVSRVWNRYTSNRSQNPSHNSPKVITIAGTNGKGSCVASMQALLLEHGYAVGAFTSPHFLRYNERICISGVPVADRHIVSAFETIEAIREDIALTYFEFNTLAALIIFDNTALDIVLLEVGLGGRLDAANIIDPDVAVLTSIDLDHQQWLGETRSEIAAEKLGIARAGRPLIIGETDYPENFQQMVNDTKATALWCGKEFDYQLEQTSFSATLSRCETGNCAAWQIDNLHAEGLLPINKLLALQALVSAGFVLQADKCRLALQNINLNGRQQEFIYRGVRVILDVAHNPAAAAVLRHSLEQEKGRTIAVASVLEDKDWDSMLAALSPVIAEWKLAQLQSVARAAEGQSLLKLLYNRGLHGTLYSSVKDAFQAALSEASSDDKIVVFGSFHTVAIVLAIILTEVSSE